MKGGGSDKTWTAGVKPEDPKVNKEPIIADNEKAEKTASVEKGLEAEVLFSQKETTLSQEEDPEVQSEADEEIEIEAGAKVGEDVDQKEELSTLFSQSSPEANADLAATPVDAEKDIKSAASAAKEKDKAEKEKTRVRDAWDRFNDELKEPAGEGNSNEDAAGKAIAKLLGVLFTGMAFNAEAIRHPQQAFRFTKDYALDSKNEAVEYVQKKVDDAKEVRDTTKKGYKGIVSLIEDLNEYANKVQAKSKLQAEPFVTATPTNPDVPPKMAIGAHRAPPEKVKAAIGAHRAPPEKVKEPIVLSAHREAPEAEVPAAEMPITLSSHREKPENEENPAIEQSLDASEMDISSQELTSTEPQTENLETLETDFSEIDEEADVENPETEFSETVEEVEGSETIPVDDKVAEVPSSQAWQKAEPTTGQIMSGTKEAADHPEKLDLSTETPKGTGTAETSWQRGVVSPTEAAVENAPTGGTEAQSIEKPKQYNSKDANAVLGGMLENIQSTLKQLMMGIESASKSDAPLSTEGKSNEEVIFGALHAELELAKAGLGIARQMQLFQIDDQAGNRFMQAHVGGIQAPAVVEQPSMGVSTTFFQQKTTESITRPKKGDFLGTARASEGVAPPATAPVEGSPTAGAEAGTAATPDAGAQPSASSEATPTIEEPKRSGGMGSGGKK